MAVKIILYKMSAEEKTWDPSFDQAPLPSVTGRVWKASSTTAPLRITCKFYGFPKTAGVPEEGESPCSSPKIEVGSKSRMLQSRV